MTGCWLQFYSTTPDHEPQLKLQSLEATPQSGPAGHKFEGSSGTALAESNTFTYKTALVLSGCTQSLTALLLPCLHAQWRHTHAAAEVKEGLPYSVLLYVPVIK